MPSCLLCSKPTIQRQNRVNKGSFWGLSTVADVQRNSPSLGRGEDETSPARLKCFQRSLLPRSFWILPVLIAGIVQFGSEDPKMCEQRLTSGECCGKRKRRGPASFFLEWIRSDHQTRTRTSLCQRRDQDTCGFRHLVEFLEHHHSVSHILQGIVDVFPRVQALGCHVHFSQPESAKFARHDRKDAEGSRQWLRGVRVTRKEVY